MISIPIAITEKQKLLIFEDEDSMQVILAEALVSGKFQLEFVSKKLIETYGAFNPALILLDHSSSPVYDEKNLCERIKAIFPAVPLIVLSAYPLNNLNSYNSYIDLFIAKPFDLGFFLNCIESCLTEG